MPISEVKRYRVACDGCERWMHDMFARPAEYWSLASAKSELLAKGWYVDGNKILCEDCCREDDDASD